MNKLVVLLIALGCIAVLIVGFSSPAATKIGTYDSRAVAIAFSNSAEGMEFVTHLRDEMSKAKAAKNDSLIREIEKSAQMQQVLAHLRAFSTASVAEILEKHKAEVEVVAKEAGVQLIVSKFELAYSSDVETVDLTLPLARIFKPREQVLQWLGDLGKHQPMPMLDVLMIPAEK
ncbi:MAG: hypothetical protein WBD36_02315 [Bacteroidota bacterium]